MDEKTLSNHDKKVAIKAELVTGANPRKLSEKYGVHYTTVIGYRNDLREGTLEAEILDVADADAHVLKVVANEVKKKVADSGALPPKSMAQFSDKVDDIVEGVSSLQLLETEFHTTITKLLKWANAQITDDMRLADWRAIASQIGELHSKVYSNGMQVNVQQNNNAGSSFTNGMVN